MERVLRPKRWPSKSEPGLNSSGAGKTEVLSLILSPLESAEGILVTAAIRNITERSGRRFVS
jgi:hypothetical protein